ncbi:DUF6465 family protein [Oribacterium sp. FC2011]|uniref:DUF6465 family protein n=1 Tax=Oribacterium sp. FC2011 TaxID=1408311 RepID=UPI0004E0B9BC|nr:DUF6465 family protein [Oribacterium sp. FC2011]
MAKTKTAAPKAAKTAAPAKSVEEKKTEAVKTVAVKKEEPKKAETAVEKKEAPKAAPKKAEATAEKKEAPKAAPKKAEAAAEKKAAPKTAAKKAAEKKPAAKKTTNETAVKAAVTLQINGIDYDPASIENDAIAAAKKIKATVKDVKIYINADESAAYFTIDGEGRDDYKINL